MASTTSFRPIRLLWIAGMVSTTLLPLPAFALDGQALLAKINAVQAENGGVQVRASEIDVSGNDVVLKNATLSVAGVDGQPDQSISPGDITLTDVEERGDGGYVIGTVAIPPIRTAGDGTEFTVGAIGLTGLVIPADPKAPGLASLSYYDKATFGPITISANGRPYLTIGGIEASMTPTPDEPGVAFETRALGITVTPEPADAAWLTNLGLETLKGDVTMAGSWLAREGTITVDDAVLTAAGLGTLTLDLGLTGMTEQLYAGMQQTTAQLKAAGGDSVAKAQASQLALFGIAQQINVGDITLSFKDDGLTGRALSSAAKHQGVSEDQVGEAVRAVVPMVLAQNGIRDPENRISSALQTFLADPQNLTIQYTPEKPVPALQLISAPLTLLNGPDMTISANEDQD
ncbi:hypothetical protein NOF55_17925 [Rhizobiaceae bacterium BDR2-2]|uniref:Uncharacterized protein n=1 Tax=Ectorhizobium quercum TaxID=2965071 RepID=A0AAE3N0Y7_9HYPH|nr:hypothetical protein [Ectorhizobium quercum]MCX8998988.1 hypothetical protein [Ectorhizobium quercum]